MKTTISNESKAVIFGRYYNSKMWVTRYTPREYKVHEMLPEIIQELEDSNEEFPFTKINCYRLLLTPLSKISKDDAIQVARLKKKNIFKETDNDAPKTPKGLSELGVGICITQSWCWEGLQYLQLKGYATPQTVIENGEVVTYSVDELVQLGVFKLKEY